MQRATFAAATSTMLLAGAIVLWPELFLFTKTLYAPAWARALPSVFLATPLLAVVCLSPVAVASPHPLSAIRWMLIPLLLAPLTGVVVYVATTSTRGAEFWGLAVTNYFYILVLHLLLPAIAVCFSCYLARTIKRLWSARR